MLTSFFVKCPNVDCGRFGSLLPRTSSDTWRGAVPDESLITFECPSCHEEWQARLVGDDIRPLPRRTVAIGN